MMENQLFLGYKDEYGATTTRSIDNVGVTLDDVLMEVTYFLRGCGYIIDSNVHLELVSDYETPEICAPYREDW